MIEIAYVINYITQNGPSNVVLNLIRNLDRSIFHVSLITLFSGNKQTIVQVLEKNGVTVYECRSLTRVGCFCGKDEEFTSIVKKGRFDILHTHGIIPDILSSRVKLPIKRVTTLHNNMFEDYLYTYGPVEGRLLIKIHLEALKKIDVCVCCSESICQVMSKYIKSIYYIRNGIESVVSHVAVTRSCLNIPESAWVFLYAGALSKRKNVVWLVRNFVHFHAENEYLLLIGSGDEAEKCKLAADSHVCILGYQEDPVAYMNISDIYVSASKSEGFSISVLEALSCGLGLFLSDIPSHCEVIAMGGSMYLGEIYDQINFGQQLGILRKKKRDIIKDNIKRFQKATLSDTVMTRNYERLYLDANKSHCLLW